MPKEVTPTTVCWSRTNSGPRIPVTGCFSLVPSDVLVFEGWEIDPASRQVRNPHGIQVQMTSAEFDLLLAFCRNPNRVLSREQLLELTHSGLAGPIERSIDVHVSRVRQKIESDPHDPFLIKTVRLGGYILTARVSMK